MGKILLKNILSEGVASDILIDGNLIANVSKSGNQTLVPEGTEVVDCTGKAAFPAFINMHTHAGMALMKGIGEDMAFHEWLDKIWQVEEHIDDEYVYCATKAAVKVLSDGLRMDLVDTPLRVTNVKPGLVETNFSVTRFDGDKERADNVYKGIKPLTGEDIAEVVYFAASAPAHVQIAEVLVLATHQASGTIVHRN